MSVQVYGCNHVALEVGDIEKAVAFYQDVFGLEKLDAGEGDAFFKIGEHQFLAMFEHQEMKADTSHRRRVTSNPELEANPVSAFELVLRQIYQGCFADFRRTIMLDFLYLLQGIVDGGFISQERVGDVELALLLRADCWNPI